jgi:diacylglycerol kinase family enzyme
MFGIASDALETVSAAAVCSALFGRVEISEEGGVLGEVGLDRLKTVLEPAFQPALAELVLDPVQIAVAHMENHRDGRGRHQWAERPNSATTTPIACVNLRGLLLINPRAGADSRPDPEELREEAERRGIEVRVLGEGEDAAAVARMATADVLGSAGGDGSIASVAAVAVERELPFVCVPFGTRNHFARDLGLDRDDPVGALDAFSGEERRVDVGRVGDRRFLNNVSLGLYGRLVHRREHRRRRGQLFAGARALWLSLRERRHVWARLDGEPVNARVLLVANNGYELHTFAIGERARLDEARVHLYAAKGWLPRSWEERVGERFTIEAAEPLEAAVDGEPALLEPPLEFSVEPRALRVLLPCAPG